MGGLKHATNLSGIWSIEIVALSSPNMNTSLVLDSSDNVHIKHSSGNNLIYLTNTTGSWIEEIVDSEFPSTGMSTSLAIDSSDKIHISYLDGLSNLKYATNATGSWFIDTIIGYSGIKNYTFSRT